MTVVTVMTVLKELTVVTVVTVMPVVTVVTVMTVVTVVTEVTVVTVVKHWCCLGTASSGSPLARLACPPHTGPLAGRSPAYGHIVGLRNRKVGANNPAHW